MSQNLQLDPVKPYQYFSMFVREFEETAPLQLGQNNNCHFFSPPTFAVGVNDVIDFSGF